MEHGLSWVVWASVVPVMLGMFSIILLKVLSNHWADAASRRTARVLGKLSHPRPRSLRG